jgi:hypothetical protein
MYLINLPFDVFAEAYVDTGVYIISNQTQESFCLYRFPKKTKSLGLATINYQIVPVAMLEKPEYKVILNMFLHVLLQRIKDELPIKYLGHITESTQGLAKNRFILSKTQKSDKWFSFLFSGQLYRYCLKVEEIQYANMEEHPSLERFYTAQDKILIRRVINRQDRLMCTFFREAMVFKKDINPFVISDLSVNPYFLLGLLNSTLLSYIYINTSSIATKDDFRQTTLAELRRLPIVEFDKDDENHLRIAALAEKMVSRATISLSPDCVDSELEGLDAQIDELAYKIYGLTIREIDTIEGYYK